MTLSEAAIAGYSILGVFGGYVLTSVLLLNCPQIVHKKKKHHFRCAHISHRGGAAERLENTMSAYHHAVQAGTQMLELDVHYTKDGQVVVSHDPDLERCTGQKGHISEYNFEDLPALKREIKVTFHNSTVCRHEGESERMPTLEEVFKAFPDLPINVDVKGEEEELIEKVAELVKVYDREKLTCWGNFKNSTINKLYKLNPEVPLFFSLRRVLLLYLWFYTGLLPFIPLKESYLEIALPDIVHHIDITIPSGRLKILQVMGWLIKSSVLFNHLKKRGIPTYLWVLNEDVDFETAFKLGAEGVMTDKPTKLTRWLNEHPHYWV